MQLRQHPDLQIEPITIANGALTLIHPLLADADAAFVLEDLTQHLDWRQDSLRIQGRTIPIPRLQAWYGEPHCHYAYSGLRLNPTPFSPLLQQLRHIASEHAAAKFNCALCNLYRNGQDSVSWHADDEPELGPAPIIASFSFGATRTFQIKPKRGGQTLAIELLHNSLLIMSGDMQRHWRHQLPKTKAPVGPRVNLTYRYIPAA
ncbi:Alkylated DNA repair protein [Hahella chejuensis KCTC 2396]|uniref:Alkylated DNA repair protein n=1 Tax=Hahella chejuensis (strain KCTC 2396) TaxID=349521 RepID=Q2SBS6_HAHCH|nr:alpha-ketoglutarate-dependent dioxygenase AlkB [Hahella chejuensis]ABC31898.1 Alkylated DNA repair protein [Hahella chejuensis KCTC 2396]